MGNYNWGRGCDGCETDHGPKPFVTNIMRVARQNQNFRTAFWTGCHLQMTLMCIPPCGEIGVEMHPDTDQFIRVEEGQALVLHGRIAEKIWTSNAASVRGTPSLYRAEHGTMFSTLEMVR